MSSSGDRRKDGIGMGSRGHEEEENLLQGHLLPQRWEIEEDFLAAFDG